MDTVDVAGVPVDPPPGGLVVPPLVPAAQFTLALSWGGDGDAHTVIQRVVQQKDTADTAVSPRMIAAHRGRVRRTAVNAVTASAATE